MDLVHSNAYADLVRRAEWSAQTCDADCHEAVNRVG
jgi:hypothetical protein